MAEVVCPPLGITERVLRKVARRKMPALQKAVRMSEKDLDRLLDTGSLTQAGLDALKKLKESDWMVHLVDNLVLETDEERQNFLNLVASRSPWLQEEMVVEIQAETGSLPIDEAEVEDASFIVHRHFGSSRRFSEQDKKLMTSLVANKAQVTKEVWTRRMESAKRELEKLRREITEKEKLIRSTSDTMKTFVKRNEFGLSDFNTKSTTEILKSSKDRKDDAMINDLITRTNFILKKFGALLLDRQSLSDQKQECLTILKEKDQRTPLHLLIKNTIQHLSKENHTTREQLKSMKVKVVNLEEQLNERDLVVDKLQGELDMLRSRLPPQAIKTNVTTTKVEKEEEEDSVDGLLHLRADNISMSPIPRATTANSRPTSHYNPMRTSTPYTNTRRPASMQDVLPPTPPPAPKAPGTTTKLTTQMPLQKTTRSRHSAFMWPNARDHKAKGCLLDI